ncbi:hypothetical protein K443DRAFT_327280 [Laccaria amethystina LaAM-08-1]|uniref:Uncharacterized protein n=1 Tax=Laccaria amethystina LaAM-08-1 TaxID=1095629 RepID=A0A0C9XW56_9AGAR|nr:hypothetical protein K443DRAFT_327280 [Laccaria amethystina LaAM-08-1]
MVCRTRPRSRRSSGATPSNRVRPVDRSGIRSRWYSCWDCGCLDPVHSLRGFHGRPIRHLYVFRRNRCPSCRCGHCRFNNLHGCGSVALAWVLRCTVRQVYKPVF